MMIREEYDKEETKEGDLESSDTRVGWDLVSVKIGYDKEDENVRVW